MTSTVKDFADGQRVSAHPATDAFMRGEVYGNVVKLGRKYVHVTFDRSGRTLPMLPENILPVPDPAPLAVPQDDAADPVAALTDGERFFFDHAGYSHGPDETPESGRLRMARTLAVAETRFIADPNITATTVPDDLPYDGDAPWDGPVYVVSLVNASGRILDSLGGVAVESVDDPYIRVVVAELADAHYFTADGDPRPTPAGDAPIRRPNLTESSDPVTVPGARMRITGRRAHRVYRQSTRKLQRAARRRNRAR